jgi:DNA-binding response OmpR family regulator
MGRILVVEDHEFLSRYLCEAIREHGHHADCAKSRENALQALTDNAAYDLVICDLVLPDGTGHMVSTLADDHRIPTLLITGRPDEIERLRKKGMACLYKPFTSAQLFAAIDTHIRELDPASPIADHEH